MPLKYSQVYRRSDYFRYTQISASGGQFISAEPTYGTEAEGRIRQGSRTGTSLSTLYTGSYPNNADAGAAFKASSDLSTFVFRTSRQTNPYGYTIYAYRNGNISLLNYSSGTASWSNPSVSADGNSASYTSSSSGVYVAKWDGSGWIHKLVPDSLSVRGSWLNSDGTLVALGNGKVYKWDGVNWVFLQSIASTDYEFASGANRLVSYSISSQTASVYEFDGVSLTQIVTPITGLSFRAISYDGTLIAFSESVYDISSGVWTEIPIKGIYQSPNFPYASFANNSGKTILATGDSTQTATFYDLLVVPTPAEGQVFSGKWGVPLSVTPELVDGPSVYWQASGLPPGLVINSSTGEVSGTPTQSGTFVSTITPSSENTSDSWRWGISGTVTFIIADKDRLYVGPLLGSALYAGSTPATSVYYGSLKILTVPGWVQLGSTILGSAAGDQLGYAVTINAAGDRVAVSAPYNDDGGSNTGAVRVLQWDGTAWGQMGTSILGNATPVNTLGQSLSMSDDGSILAVSSITGYVRVYEWNGTDWAQKGSDIFQTSGNPATGAALFGISISLNASGSRLAIGAPNGLGYSGYTRVYEWSGTSWVQLGANITSLVSGDQSGYSVALNDSGSRVVIGARFNSSGGSASGHTFVMEWDGTTWSQLGSQISGSAAGDESGYSVAINSVGDRIAIGARYHDQPSSNAGNARVFEYTGTTWAQLGGSILGAAADDWSGASVSLNATGDIVAVGSELADSSGQNSGHVRVFQYNGSSWVKVGADIKGSAANDKFFKVALNAAGNRLIAGAPFNDAAAQDAGHARVFEFA
jgi:hypothetical protein